MLHFHGDFSGDCLSAFHLEIHQHDCFSSGLEIEAFLKHLDRFTLADLIGDKARFKSVWELLDRSP